jgi:hypothetical protein
MRRGMRTLISGRAVSRICIPKPTIVSFPNPLQAFRLGGGNRSSWWSRDVARWRQTVEFEVEIDEYQSLASDDACWITGDTIRVDGGSMRTRGFAAAEQCASTLTPHTPKFLDRKEPPGLTPLGV